MAKEFRSDARAEIRVLHGFADGVMPDAAVVSVRLLDGRAVCAVWWMVCPDGSGVITSWGGSEADTVDVLRACEGTRLGAGLLWDAPGGVGQLPDDQRTGMLASLGMPVEWGANSVGYRSPDGQRLSPLALEAFFNLVDQSSTSGLSPTQCATMAYAAVA